MLKRNKMAKKRKNSKKEKQKRKSRFKLKILLARKVEVLSMVFFILAIFLLDVNANVIGAYGQGITVNIINGIRYPATTMFWAGFIAACLFFIILATRTIYHPLKARSTLRKKFDLIFGIIGTLGLMIILSGGMLLFWHNNALQIPFFSIPLTRIGFYHSGVAILLLTILYYALTN